MSCYRCGSDQGNEARLCPACNEQRSNEQSERIAQLSRRTEDEPIPQLTYGQKVLLSVGAALLVIGLTWLLTPSSTPVENPSPIDEAMKACILRAMGSLDPAGDPEALSQATSTCEAIMRPCATAPNSSECVEALSAAFPR